MFGDYANIFTELDTNGYVILKDESVKDTLEEWLRGLKCDISIAVTKFGTWIIEVGA